MKKLEVLATCITKQEITSISRIARYTSQRSNFAGLFTSLPTIRKFCMQYYTDGVPPVKLHLTGDKITQKQQIWSAYQGQDMYVHESEPELRSSTPHFSLSSIHSHPWRGKTAKNVNFTKLWTSEAPVVPTHSAIRAKFGRARVEAWRSLPCKISLWFANCVTIDGPKTPKFYSRPICNFSILRRYHLAA